MKADDFPDGNCSDEELAERVSAGNDDLWQMLATRVVAIACPIIRGEVGNRDDWEDLQQNCLLRFFRALPAYISRKGPAMILSEFPSRRRQALPFLAWLRDETDHGTSSVLAVSSDSRPTAGLEFEATLCESRVAPIGRRVATLRLQKGWNRTKLSRTASVQQADVAMLESGVSEIVDAAVIGRLADALGVGRRELADPNARQGTL